MIKYFMAIITGLLASCGGSMVAAADAADLALNTITDTAQPTYELVRDYCSTAQWTIVHDQTRTVPQKEAAIAKVRSRCHEIYDLFEEIIKRQRQLRALIEASRKGTGDALKALNQIPEIQQLLATATSLFKGLKEL